MLTGLAVRQRPHNFTNIGTGSVFMTRLRPIDPRNHKITIKLTVISEGFVNGLELL
jgi:hypothetical protein